MYIKIKNTFASALVIGTLFVSCTKLDEKLNDSISTTPIQNEVVSLGGGTTTQTSNSLLQTAYNKLASLTQAIQNGLGQLEEVTSDEALTPTRGTDWDDAGQWRALCNHAYTATGNNAAKVKGAFDDIKACVKAATDVLIDSKSSPLDKAQARLINAYAIYYQYNFWGQIATLNNEGAAVTKKGAPAMDYIIEELKATEAALTDAGNPLTAYIPSKSAANALLMRCYLNRECLTNRSATPATPSVADMNKVIELADKIIATGAYKVNAKYFNSFSTNNGETATDLIFSSKAYPGANAYVSTLTRWMSGLHYNQTPSGWNGWCTLGDFYNKFDAADSRLTDATSLYTKLTGTKLGLLYGQQVDEKGKELMDRKGNKLFFTKEIDIVEKNILLESRGIRVFKYEPDIANASSNTSDNDAAIIRYPEVLLMKAEAILRGGTPTTVPPATVADIAAAVSTVRNSTKALVTLDDIYDERGRELYWESLRRTDMIRFGKYLNARPTKNAGVATDAKVLYFPVPTDYVKDGLVQNPGY